METHFVAFILLLLLLSNGDGEKYYEQGQECINVNCDNGNGCCSVINFSKLFKGELHYVSAE